MVRRLLLLLALLGLLPTAAVAAPLVVIDPGHGGGDRGARGVLPPGTQTGLPQRLDPDGRTLLLEKDVNLDVAFRLNHYLITQGYSTLLTRNTDNGAGDAPYVSESADLRKRVKIANDANATMFVSLHQNALAPTTSGTETFHYYYSSPQSKALARVIHRRMLGALNLPDRGVRSAGFYVLKHTKMPAVLVEGAFLSNPKEALLLSDPIVRQRIAEAAGAGIVEYVNAGHADPKPVKPPKYQVNAGSFRRLKDARARLALTRKRGFKKTIVRNEYNMTLRRYMYVVRAGIFSDLDNAKTLRSQLIGRRVPATIGGIPRASHPVRVR